MHFDELSHIPGPKLAAASLWYEFFFDAILKGRYAWKIKDLREIHGMLAIGMKVRRPRALRKWQVQSSGSALAKFTSMTLSIST